LAATIPELKGSFYAGVGLAKKEDLSVVAVLILSGAISTMQGMWQGFAGFMSSAIAAFEGAVSGASDLGEQATRFFVLGVLHNA
jgi:hypothetical protein